jgi:hypothetical protein
VNEPSTRREILHQMGGLAVAGALTRVGALPAGAVAADSRRHPMLDFAEAEILTAARAANTSVPKLRFELDASLGEQAYRVDRVNNDTLLVTGGDATGAMYGGLDVAEALRFGPAAMGRALDRRVRRPLVLRRGIKFNIPLDLRTPSYADGSTAARANIPEVWTHEFWRRYFDELARYRYNVVTLWSLHPFPSLVKVPEYPDVALDDVWRSKEPLGPVPFDSTGRDAIPPRFLANHEVIRKITIGQKIAFWRDVMRMAADRGIEIYIFTWNVFTYGVQGKYGIDDRMSNPATVSYMRASVRELVKTYPLLKGLGITAGENMPTTPGVSKEQWLWSTYGEGVRDALKSEPDRDFRLIHRFWQTTGDEIRRNWTRYPGWPDKFAFSFKYSWAHMYSDVKPPFVAEVMPLLKELGMKTWLTVRNDDIFSLRWGDPEYVRQYVLNMPSADKLDGFYMGPDGFTWGRDFLDRETSDQHLGAARPLVMDKHWYSFMLWGRLSYDPILPDTHFEEALSARFPGVDARRLYSTTTSASKIIPQTTRFFWRDIDLAWFPEACARYDRALGTHLYTVAEFMNGVTMPGTQILNIRQWRYRLTNGIAMEVMTPLDVADALAGFASSSLTLARELRAVPTNLSSRELRQTIGDNEAMAQLGIYYAEKIRGACDLALFDASAAEEDRQSAIAHLELAVSAWKRYAAVRDAQYLPGFYSRIGWIDITALTQVVAEDVEIARGWPARSLKFDPNSPAEQHIGDAARTGV